MFLVSLMHLPTTNTGLIPIKVNQFSFSATLVIAKIHTLSYMLKLEQYHSPKIIFLMRICITI